MYTGINAVAQAFDATVNSDVVSMRDYNTCIFIVHWGVGTTGTTVLTVEAVSNVGASNPETVKFYYRENQDAITLAATTGFNTTAGSNQTIMIEVKADFLPASKPFVQLQAVENDNDPLLGGVLIMLMDPRHPQDQLPVAVT